MSHLPRSRGSHNSGSHLLGAINNVESLIRADEFPHNRSDLQRSLNVLKAFHRMHREDFTKGFHHEIPGEIELEPMPVARREFVAIDSSYCPLRNDCPLEQPCVNLDREPAVV